MKLTCLTVLAFIMMTFTFANREGNDRYMVLLDDKYGYFDAHGSVVIEPQFVQAGNFSCGVAPVVLRSVLRNPVWGYIDYYGNPASDEVFQQAFEMHDCVARAKQRNEWVITNAVGDIIRPENVTYMRDFSEGLAAANTGGEVNLIGGVSGGKWGFLDKNGEWVIPPVYDNATRFTQQLAPVRLEGLWGYINKDQEAIIGHKYLSAEPFKNGVARVFSNAEPAGWQIISMEGEYLRSNVSRVETLPGGQLAFQKTDNAGWIMPESFEHLTPGIEDIRSCSAWPAPMRFDGSWFYVDAKGEQALNDPYLYAGCFKGALAEVYTADTHLWIDRQGNIIRRADLQP